MNQPTRPAETVSSERLLGAAMDFAHERSLNIEIGIISDPRSNGYRTIWNWKVTISLRPLCWSGGQEDIGQATARNFKTALTTALRHARGWLRKNAD